MDPETVIAGMFVLGVCGLLEFASHIDPATGHWVAGKGVLAWLRATRWRIRGQQWGSRRVGSVTTNPDMKPPKLHKRTSN